MNGQISMFDMLGMDETPEIPFEDQKAGVRGWIIEIQGIYTVENGFPENMIGVTTELVQLNYDSHVDKYGYRHQSGSVIKDGCRGDGWTGAVRKLYAARPTWNELVKYARENHKEPWKVVFTLKNGDAMVRICDFETKKQISPF